MNIRWIFLIYVLMLLCSCEDNTNEALSLKEKEAIEAAMVQHLKIFYRETFLNRCPLVVQDLKET